MPKPTSRQKIFSIIIKNVHSKNWKCVIDGCEEKAINSHLLQQNGILDNVSVEGHLIEYKQTDPLTWSEDTYPFHMKRIGKNKAFSLPLFCNNHDTNIFKEAETHPINIESYRVHLLLSYRVICAEIRKKQTNVELFTRILNAKSLLRDNSFEEIKISKEGNELGLKDLDRYKKLFEEELSNESSNFTFKVYKYPLIKIYCSAVFSLIDYFVMDPKQLEPLNNVFIHVIPCNEVTNIIVGYNNDYVDDCIKKYVDSWEGLNKVDFEKHLTKLFTAHIENWGMSPDLFSEIKDENLKLFKKYTFNNANNHLLNQRIKFNLFE